MAAPAAPAASGAPATTGIGFATGGAQDIANFRENVKEGYLPLPTDVTFGGIVKDYYFDTTSNASDPCTELFCPMYSLALSPDPLLNASDGSSPPDVYLAVGLDSGLTPEDFKRKQLNLVILLDVSGSMGATFDAYYYDSYGVRQNLTQDELKKTKIDVAKEVVQGVLGKLDPGDRVSIVLFETNACVPKPLGLVSCANMEQIEAGVARDVVPLGSTNLQDGWDQAVAQLQSCGACMAASLNDTENRIILITDAEPNTGDFTTAGLASRLSAAAAGEPGRAPIHTTIVGVGYDFNTELVEAISKVRGLNYYSIHTPGEFKERLDDQFDYMVTPLVFDLSLSVDPASTAAGWRMLAAYGSPNPNDTALGGNGTIMRVNTLFPSPQTEEGIKGGVVLLRMAPPNTSNSDASANAPLKLSVSYTDRAGSSHNSLRSVELPEQLTNGLEFYQSTGVEKAVVLARYTDLLQTWLLDQWGSINKTQPIVIPLDLCGMFPSYFCPVVSEFGQTKTASGTACQLTRWLVPGGCILPPPYPVLQPLLSRWERQSQELAVNSDAKKAMQQFLPYLQEAQAATGDSTLGQEVDMLNKLIAA